MKEIKIGDKIVGENNSVYIIAESGCNHDGKLEQAFKIVKSAYENGADAIKFQLFKAEKLVTKNTPQWWLPEDKVKGTRQIDLYLNQDMFGFDEFKKISDYCKSLGITFLATPFDDQSADLLDKLNVPAFKIASTDLTNLPFLEYVAKKNKPMLISVGMGSLEEIKEAVNVVEETGNKQIALLHCIVEYPTPISDANLNFIKTLQKNFPDYVIGFSDHTLGTIIPVVAATLGARVIEKHFTIDKSIRGAPDHIISVDPKDLSIMVKDIRAAEDALGSSERVLLHYEKLAYEHGRRKIVANVYIPKGTIIQSNMIACKRNNEGLPPKHFKEVIGKKAAVDLNEDDPISEDKIY